VITNFGDFSAIFGGEIGIFLEPMLWSILCKFSVTKVIFLHHFFRRNNFKIKTLIPSAGFQLSWKDWSWAITRQFWRQNYLSHNFIISGVCKLGMNEICFFYSRNFCFQEMSDNVLLYGIAFC
jgi:hypothetical protein